MPKGWIRTWTCRSRSERVDTCLRDTEQTGCHAPRSGSVPQLAGIFEHAVARGGRPAPGAHGIGGIPPRGKGRDARRRICAFGQVSAISERRRRRRAARVRGSGGRRRASGCGGPRRPSRWTPRWAHDLDAIAVAHLQRGGRRRDETEAVIAHVHGTADEKAPVGPDLARPRGGQPQVVPAFVHGEPPCPDFNMDGPLCTRPHPAAGVCSLPRRTP